MLTKFKLDVLAKREEKRWIAAPKVYLPLSAVVGPREKKLQARKDGEELQEETGAGPVCCVTAESSGGLPLKQE